MSSPPLPTIILVHGAWHTPAAYQPFISALEAQGFTVHCPLLPSCAQSLAPSQDHRPASLPEDVACVRSLISTLADKGDRILMLLHSYGGIVGTDAMTRDLTWSDRRSRGQTGGVIHLAYLCAYMLQPGGSIVKTMEEANASHLWDIFIDNGPDGLSFPKDPIAQLYNTVEKEEAEEAVRHLVRFPYDACITDSTGEAWRYLPVTYVATEKDYTLLKDWQDRMVEKVRAQGVEVKMVEFDACHSVFLSRKNELVKVVVDAASDERNPQ
ncbi:alpha/beta-hydrolase [Aspergillus sclerotiicarbonarius CBS 121057]|uniref:Alpha/beta-hydrolase n=1 Tax=Aspergillus sclerotiicarbonarius (strain CBS 121057 / IBT 28362) TaxID=1448318 RepID=A0A319E3U5_ASPSB|nr:alpha/beta-hydrolase [Aspergillus sclerotiicarbonarius CBS 121057]